MVGSRREDPGLFRVELDVQHSDFVGVLVSLEHFERHNQGILHEVVVDVAVEDVDAA